MKKLISVLIVAAFISVLFFAQQASAADEAKTIIGKIESITKVMGKPPKWLYAIVTVVPDSGEKIEIYIPKASPVTDVSGNDMTEGGKKLGALFLKKGQRVEITYTTGTLQIKSRNEGLSIRCLD